jgi:hypothetical protein
MASVLMEKSETITLDLCTSILPVVTDLLESKIDRYLLQRLRAIMMIYWGHFQQSLLARSFDWFMYGLC